MVAQQVKILPGKTIRMNLATTKTFNADKVDVRNRQHPCRLVEIPMGKKCINSTFDITV